MKVAAFNVENLFDRAKAFNKDTNTSRLIIEGVAELNNIFEKNTYSVAAVSYTHLTLPTNREV